MSKIGINKFIKNDEQQIIVKLLEYCLKNNQMHNFEKSYHILRSLGIVSVNWL